MTVWAVDGAAGHGKTHRLIEEVVATLAAAPLAEGQRVLALTFMHGSRRRLDERLRKLPDLNGRFECMTIDSFARRLRQRWRSLSRAMGFSEPEEGPQQFSLECQRAGVLLGRPVVSAWVGKSFPILVIDEAQDLTEERLSMIRALSQATCVLLAEDEFQCLDQTLKPNPVHGWLPTVCQIQTLTEPKRTKVSELLGAAVALRTGQPPVFKGKMRAVAAPSFHVAAACVAAALTWNAGGGPVAILTPAPKSPYVRSTIARVQSAPCGKKRYGPFPIAWEESEHEELERLAKDLLIGADLYTLEASLHAVEAMPDSGPRRQTADWLRRQARVVGRNSFSREEILEALRRYATARRHRTGRKTPQFSAMTIHQAKNREFAGVIVLWPYEIGGDADAKRRLLYNALTRAQLWCTVIVPNEKLLKAAPFA